MSALDTNSWKESFFKEGFSVDQCLAECTQKSDLETLKRDLKTYGAELQMHMSEILRNETEAIVNLAEYLTNLSSKIDELSVPISQLREEIRTLFELIKGAENEYKIVLSKVKTNQSKQNHAHLKLGILNSALYINTVISPIETNIIDNLIILERVVNKYSFQKIYLDELSLITPDIEKVIENVEIKLVKNINQCFLQAFNAENTTITLRCLRMYADLQKQDEAHNLFRTSILKSELKSILTEKCLEQSDQDLNKLYDKVKQVLDTKVEFIQKILKENPDLGGFNFILKAFWQEFDSQSREGLPHITAPGNPELFQKRFTSTYQLLKYITLKGDGNYYKSFEDHLRRFNLPVYFEIKYQQIAGSFETETFALNFNNIGADSNDYSFKLKPSLILLKALKTCFNQEVYIDQLADHFIKLSMLLISRYVNLMLKLCTTTTDVESRENTDVFIVDVLADLSKLKDLLTEKCDMEKSIFVIINPSMKHILLKVFELNGKVLGRTEENFASQLVAAKISVCSGQLQNVTAIPRLYRRTNRNPPKEASGYIVEVVKQILHFENRFRTYRLDRMKQILDDVITQITNQYFSLVQEVLKSVLKTEESLRRLKSRNPTSNGDDSVSQGPSTIMSDETKIREQIKYDVGYFCDKLFDLASKSSRNAMDLLKKEVFI